MVATTNTYSVDDLLKMPNGENFELWHGELVEVSPSSINSSAIALWIAVRISLFVESRNLGFVSGENGGYLLFPNRDTVVAPDVGFVRWERLADRRRPKGFCGVAPDLAVEVTSPSDEPGEITRKLSLYMEAGVPLVWWFYPDRRIVNVHRPGQITRTLREGDILSGEDVLKGFELKVSEVFAD